MQLPPVAHGLLLVGGAFLAAGVILGLAIAWLAWVLM
jgi:hypothetical protein